MAVPILIAFSWCAFLAWMAAAVLTALGVRLMPPLQKAIDSARAAAGPDGRYAAASSPPGGAPAAHATGPHGGAGAPPVVSVIVTARDEEEGIGSTVRSLLAQRGVALEVIVVDDRSTDRTAAILDRLAAAHAVAHVTAHAAAPNVQEPGGTAEPRGGTVPLAIVHNRELPAGWLGKCNACRIGAGQARGEWLLFTDGDVNFLRPDLIATVHELAERRHLDHVALFPDNRPVSPLQMSMIAVFGQMLLTAARAWEMDRDRRRGGIGVGAFNMMRRSSYDAVGGHERLRLDLADDVKLGQLLKAAGARQRIYDATGWLHCAWHSGVLNVVRGLEKNFFGGLEYSVLLLAAMTAGMFAVAFGPLAGAIGATWLGSAGAARLVAAWLPFALQAAAVYGMAWTQVRRGSGSAILTALAYPLGVVLVVAAAWNSALRTLYYGGVRWRDTFYPLAALRAGLVRPGRAAGIAALVLLLAAGAHSPLAQPQPPAPEPPGSGYPGTSQPPGASAASSHTGRQGGAGPAVMTPIEPPDLDRLVLEAQRTQVSDTGAWAHYRFHRRAERDMLDAGGSTVGTEDLEFEIIPRGSGFDETLLEINGTSPSEEDVDRQRRSAPFTRRYWAMVQGIEDGDTGGYSLSDLLRMAEYHYAGVEIADGVPCHRLDFRPGEAKGTGGLRAKFGRAMAGSLWISVDGLHLVRARARTLRPISVALSLTKVHHLEVSLDAAPVGDGVFLPTRIELVTDARILMVPYRRRDLWEYSSYVREEAPRLHAPSPP